MCANRTKVLIVVHVVHVVQHNVPIVSLNLSTHVVHVVHVRCANRAKVLIKEKGRTLNLDSFPSKREYRNNPDTNNFWSLFR